MMAEGGSVIHLTLLHLNVCGLRTRRDELPHFLQESHTDVGTINEIFLTARLSLFFPGYGFFRQDNNYRSRGVAILVRNFLRAQQISVLQTPTESFLVILSFSISTPLFIATY